MKTKTIILLLCSCVLLAPVVAAEPVTGSTEDIQAIAEPLLENILGGFENNDYEQYTHDFDTFLKEAMPAAKFRMTDRQLEENMGDCTDKEYLGFLNQEKMTVVLWKGQFSATSNDILIKLVLSQRGEDVVVTGLWFQ